MMADVYNVNGAQQPQEVERGFGCLRDRPRDLDVGLLADLRVQDIPDLSS